MRLGQGRNGGRQGAVAVGQAEDIKGSFYAAQGAQDHGLVHVAHVTDAEGVVDQQSQTSAYCDIEFLP